jgi:hypothetical protein
MTSASALDSGMVQVTPSAGSCALAVIGESIATRVPIARTSTDLRIDMEAPFGLWGEEG